MHVEGRFRASKGHRPARAKPPGEIKKVIFPGPPPSYRELVERLHMRGGSGCRGLPEFPLAAEATLCKVAAFVPGGLSGSRQRLGVCERRGCGIVAGRPLSRVESGAKPPGGNKMELPPGPPLVPITYEKRLHMFGGSGCRGEL